MAFRKRNKRSAAHWRYQSTGPGGPPLSQRQALQSLGGYERSQMISSAIGRPTPNDPPMINAIARRKPSPARNSCHDMPLLLQGRCPRIHLTVVVNDSRPNVVLSAGAATQRRLASVNCKTESETSSISPYVSIRSEGTGSNLLTIPPTQGASINLRKRAECGRTAPPQGKRA